MILSKGILIERMTENLPTLRACLRVTQTELALKIGVSRSVIVNIETRKVKMKWKTFLSLFEVFSRDEKCCACLSVFGLLASEINNLAH